MSGLTGTGGVAGTAGAAGDMGTLATILSDPNALAASLKQYSDARDAAEQAAADSLVKVEQAKALAANILADAQAEADKLITDAQEKANALVADARSKADAEDKRFDYLHEQCDATEKNLSALIDIHDSQDKEWSDGAKAREKAYSDAMASAAKREEAADIIISDYKNRIADITARASALADAATIAVKGL
jgi:hypothetical protein